MKTNALLAAAYAVWAWCGFMLALPPGVVCPIWPPSGIAAAALLLGGPELWPGVVVGSFIANAARLASDQPGLGSLLIALSIAAGSAVQALLLRKLVLRWAGERFLDTPRGVIRFAGAVIAACPVSATFGVGALLLSGRLELAQFPLAWFTWFGGDGAGVLIVTTLLLSQFLAADARAVWETAAFVAAATVLSIINNYYELGWPVFGFRFLTMPLIILAAFRVRQRGVTMVCAALGSVTLVLTAAGFGPFALQMPHSALISVQAYLIMMSFSALAVAAAVARYEATERELLRARAGLLEAVRQRTALLADAETVAALGSWSWDLDQERIEFSDGLKALFGLPQDARVSSDTLLDLVAPEDRERVSAAVRQASEKGGYEIEYSMRLPDGRPRTVVSRGRVLIDRGGKPTRMIGTIQDVTERRRAEGALREIDIVRERDRLRKEFMANVSHELRTPIASVLGFSETLLRGALDDRANRREFVETIQRNAAWLARLVEDLLDMAALDSGKKAPRPESVSLSAAFAEARRSIDALADKRGITLEGGSGLEQQVKADRDHLRRILQNVLDNAVKFSEKGGRVVVAARRVDADVEIAVRDEGCGIAAHELPKIFERFHRAGATRDRVGGTGLGLAIVKQLAEANGGGVGIESAPGHGTTLRVRLPQV
jgi:PAS domain S-box-containing protein